MHGKLMPVTTSMDNDNIRTHISLDPRVGLQVIFTKVVHDVSDGLLDVIDTFAHLVDAPDDVAGHVLEALLHLLQQVLDELVELLCGLILLLGRHTNGNLFEIIITTCDKRYKWHLSH